MVRWLWTVLATATMAGCGITDDERDAIGAFARATGDLTLSSEGALVRMREETVAHSRAILKAGNPHDAPINARDLDRALDPEDVAARLLALRALTRYAALLESLASDDRLGAQGAELGAVLGAVAGLDPEALAALASYLSGAWSEASRERALREVIGLADPIVAALCEHLERDLDAGGGGFASQLLVARSDAIAAGIEGVSLDDPALAALLEGVRALRETHRSLAESGGAWTWEDVEAFVVRVHEGVALVEVVTGAQ
ncbi:MAG: hypothetical protein Tsb0013_10510 [Phycisphaerales bacterium]